jgi:hypothetical protein
MRMTNQCVRIYRQDMPEACPYSKCVAADGFPLRVHSCDSWARKRNAGQDPAAKARGSGCFTIGK